MIVFLAFYVDSISGFFLGIVFTFYLGWKAEEPHNCFNGIITHYVVCKGEFGVGPWKNIFLPWRTPRKLLEFSYQLVSTKH